MTKKKNKGGRRNPRKRKQRNSKNEANLIIRKDILKYLQKQPPTHAFSARQLARASGLHGKVGRNKIRSIVNHMAHDGLVEFTEDGRVRLLSEEHLMTGRIQIIASGMGFLLLADQQDVMIRPNSTGKAMNGDTVQVRVVQRKGRGNRGRATGQVVKVVERARTKFVGTLVDFKYKKDCVCIPDSHYMPFEFHIPQKELGEAKPGDKVLVELMNWERKNPVAKVVEVLGKAGEHNTEMHAILHHFGFDPEFPREIEEEAEKISAEIPKEEIKNRRDMRGITTFTIDPFDAKDFDDALSFQKLDNGRYEIGIHIADVSYYVRPGTAIDAEAARRATSVYLVDRTVPMLPEKLSNGLCSLRPKEEKLTYSAVFEMDDEGKVHKQWFGRTVTYSDHRFTYEEAQAVLENKSEGPFKEELHILNKIAYKLREQRFKTGSIDFDTEEIKFKLDENDKPIGVFVKERKDSNRLIEDFMLLANRSVARYVAKMKNNPKLPFVYRVHDSPDPDKLQKLQEFVKNFGYQVEFGGKSRETSQAMKNLLESVKGKAEQNLIETISIRSMAKAIYTTSNIGHFGLGFEYYSHFTSPIRRYPDLMVHRLITQYHDKNYTSNIEKLEQQCQQSSNMEKRAEEAERASVKYKQVEFLSDKIGEHFKGIVSGVTEHGIFVVLDEMKCEGMVRVSSINDDYYEFDEANYCLKGRDTGRTIHLGDEIWVEVLETDLNRRTIDFALLDDKE